MGSNTGNGHPMFYELLDRMRDIHDRKNADYAVKGDPLQNFRECERAGIPMCDGILTRLSDKYARLMVTSKLEKAGGSPAVAETIEDTLLDMANYALLLIIARTEVKK
jgi:hypothetical protein